MKPGPWVVAVVLAGCACSKGAAPAAPSGAPVATVSYEGDFNLIFVEVAVGDAPPRWFILDSGADQTLLDAAAAKELGVQLVDAGSSAQPGGEIQIAHAKDVTFHLGAAAFTAPDVWVTALSPLYRFVGRKFDGLLGHAFLERYVTAISYRDHRITLYEPKTFDYRGKGTVVPVEIADGEAYLHAMLDTGAKRVDAKLKIDTGSIDTIGLNGSFVQAEAVFAADQPRAPQLGVAIGGATQGFVTRLPSLTIGTEALGPMVVGYSAETERTGDAGTIGAEVLRRFDVIFDYTRNRLVLEPNPARDEPFPVDCAGLFGATFEDDLHRFVILAVTPDTAAAQAGLAAGDEIAAIDGTSFADYGLTRLFARVHQPGPVKLTIRRDGVERPVDLVLRPVL